MGVTISSKNYSIDLGYGGFSRLRDKVAELTNQRLFEHYEKLCNFSYMDSAEREIFFEKYDKKIKKIAEEEKIQEGILMFLYEPDCGSTIKHSFCKPVFEVIKDYDDDLLYGYAGRLDCAKFKDFKNIIEDCIKTKCDLEWY